MNISKATATVRQAIRSTGNDPKGRVRIVRSDYTTEIEVDLCGIWDVKREFVEDVINNIEDDGTFSWNVN